jgi:hypothetical protein
MPNVTFRISRKVFRFGIRQVAPITVTYQNLYTIGTLAGDIDNINCIFTTGDNFMAGSTIVFVNGLKQKLNVDYTESGDNEITFTEAPTNIGFDDNLEIIYIKG